MKNLLSVLVLVSFLSLMVAPVAIAQVEVPTEVTQCTMRNNLTGAAWTTRGFTCPGVAVACPFNSTIWTCGSCCVIDTVYTVSNWVFLIVLAFALIFIMIGAFMIITAGGAAEKVNTGRNYILYATIGFIVGLAAKMIPAIARSMMGLY